MGKVAVGSGSGLNIQPTFMGLSHEWGDGQRTMGSSGTGVNSIYRQLLKNLTSYGSGPVILRIGGNSTDLQGLPNPALAPPLVELSKDLGTHFYLGVNLGSNDVSLAQAEGRFYLSQMPPGSVDALEIGNEPDLYYRNGKRASNYNVTDYYADFNTWKISLSPIISGKTKLMGAAWATLDPLHSLPTYLDQQSAALGTFSQHYYAVSQASNPPANILLQPAMASNGPQEVASAVALAHAQGLPFRMGEFNSIDDTGIHGISDAFGAALWSIDTMFQFASVGVDGVNVEASNGNYDNPFYFTTTKKGSMVSYTLSSINPLYYGMLFFQAATGNQASLLPVTINTQANLTAWATMDSKGTPRLVLINKDETQSGPVAVSFPGYNHASVLRLTAPSYQAFTGISFAGQTLDGSTDGTLQGTQVPELNEGSNGTFQINMPITSAALISFTP